MARVPQDVDDREAREAFLREGVFVALAALTADAPSEWGRMTAQHARHHLLQFRLIEE